MRCGMSSILNSLNMDVGWKTWWGDAQTHTPRLQGHGGPVAYPVGWFGGSTPPPEIPKALQNRAKLNPIVKTVKKIAEFRTPTPKDVRKKRQ